MRRILSSWALAALVAAPLSLTACGDDDDTPPPGGDAGSAGKPQGGGSGGKPSTTPQGGSDGGAPEPPEEEGGKGGEDPGTTPSAGSSGEGGADPGPPPSSCDLTGEGLEREDLPASIEEDTTLDTGIVWVINGEVKVREGATLTIPPCSRLEAAPGRSFLTVLRGGKLEAEGTAEEPILFTSFEPEGDRNAGDWGGIVLLGRAPITGPGGNRESQYEGLTDEDYQYGGEDENDSSGTLRYVRIEFSGFVLSEGKEINGLSMAGVGKGTTIDHVMVNQTADDCFEWWGGNVVANYLICNNPGDDYFDGDEGWQGGGRYWFGRRELDVISSTDPNGFELDSINYAPDAAAPFTPRTNFDFQNVTLCGPGEAYSAYPLLGAVFRERVTGSIDNWALTGFEYGIDTRDAFSADDVEIQNARFFGLVNEDGISPSESGDANDFGFDDASLFTGDDSNELNPSPAPFSVEDCLNPSGPTRAVLESGIGAFPEDSLADWQLDKPWVDWSSE